MKLLSSHTFMSNNAGVQPGPLGKVAASLSRIFFGGEEGDASVERGVADVDDAAKNEGLTDLLVEDSHSELLAIVLQALPERREHARFHMHHTHMLTLLQAHSAHASCLVKVPFNDAISRAYPPTTLVMSSLFLVQSRCSLIFRHSRTTCKAASCRCVRARALPQVKLWFV